MLHIPYSDSSSTSSNEQSPKRNRVPLHKKPTNMTTPPTELCHHFMTFRCKYKNNCRKIHDRALCRQYYQGRCSRTSNECKYSHDFTPPQQQTQQQNPKNRTHAGQSQKRVLFNPEQTTQQNTELTTEHTKKEPHQHHKPTKNTKVPKHQEVNPKNKNKYSKDTRNTEQQHNQHNKNQNQNNQKHKNNNNKRKRKPKNTESFDPDLSPPDMRLMIEYENKTKYPHIIQENDVIILPKFFNDNDNDNDSTIYDKLLDEMKQTDFNQDKIWKLWHGDSHFIADDKLGDWKSQCPTFTQVINKMAEYFDVNVKATRFNWYKDNKDWKPYHRDAAAIDSKKAKTQNITIGMTFGATRTASFQHLHTKTRIDFPLSNGSVYIFCKQVNVDWMHGIVQEPEYQKDGRISIIIWGKSRDMLSL